MNKATPTELQIHGLILDNDPQAFSLLTNQYSNSLLQYVNQWYGLYTLHDRTLADEAVYETLKKYSEHPRLFSPEQNSLQQYLEISVNRTMQHILNREHIIISDLKPEQILVKYFDNAIDIEIAMLILKGSPAYDSFVNLLEIGGLRIDVQIHEIDRYKNRIKKILLTKIGGTIKTAAGQKKRRLHVSH